ncbi:MAG TPA: class II fructose-1,6-bisphosphate aldolase [Firmicutes bacterium]|uniref:fructose-bisphosphate aldolase n=1 Tax=Candidatus Coatesbacteria bacterium 4484_99 TaxID=1970774 RepID=A0A1W9S311_9BACT|nr:MAG: fructose-1,6-bisphosphate aldolase, class II [Candidatus Coatesbacteria bacterium 4484_99]RLC43375.1 MAG: class II fructose-1,6-bisphosphate aldolase [Candidatus Coatesbacteria bacterium]RLC44864.1 MAG: class II fructose-1,6-bisphosphate aldolase [Candidatus Coatesbacteria bacterium]HDM43325.1 class II fructose-1,6-bisphosphate aldolase [Bacillota bacterium]
MPLVSAKEILEKAKNEHYAVGAFNINNMEILQGIINACRKYSSPAIIGASEGAIRYAGFKYIVSMVKLAADESGLPIALHLDHGKNIDTIAQCIGGGFTSIMIDGSHLNFEENIKVTKQVVDLARPKGLSVEGELGRLSGIEDLVDVEERDATLTDPDSAVEFVERTGVDFLAVAIGTSHGAYKFKGDPKLDIKRLKEIKEKVNIPLVLHGASSVPEWVLKRATTYGAVLKGAKGVPEDAIKEAIDNGICKINIDTDLRLALLGAVREVLSENPEEFDPRKYLGAGRDAIEKVVSEKIALFGSAGKA